MIERSCHLEQSQLLIASTTRIMKTLIVLVSAFCLIAASGCAARFKEGSWEISPNGLPKNIAKTVIPTNNPSSKELILSLHKHR